MSDFVVPVTDETIMQRLIELGIPTPNSPAWDDDLNTTMKEFFSGRLLKVIDLPNNKIFISTV